jgi:hypothetical protein
MLRGRASQYDEVWNKGLSTALAGSPQELGPNFMGSLNTGGASDATAGPGGPTRPISKVASDVYNSAGGAYEAGMGGGNPASDTNETVGQSSLQPMPQPRPKGPTIGSEDEPDVNEQNLPIAKKEDQTGQDEGPFSSDLEKQAWRLYPNIFGDAAKRAEYVRSQGEEEQKHQNKLEENEAIWGHKENIANLVGKNRLSIQDLKNQLGDRLQAQRTALALRLADTKMNMGRESNLSKQFNSYVQSGQIGKMPPQLLQQATDMINRVSEQEQRSQGPLTIQGLGGNPNAGGPPSGSQVMIINNKPYVVDPSGKVIGPAQ